MGAIFSIVVETLIEKGIDKGIEKGIEKGIDKGIDIFAECISKLKEEEARLQAVKPELHKLDSTRKRILAVLEDAEQRRYIEDEIVHLRLRDLKAVAFDVEDIVDEFRTYEILVSKVCRRDFADRIQKIRDECDRVVKENNDLRFQSGEVARRFTSENRQVRRREGSLQDDHGFHGRQDDTEAIVNKLLNFGSGDKVQVISIVGSGGSGKTSLARNIFKDDRSKNHFDLMIWVSLSENFDLVRTIKEVIKAVERRECYDSTLDLLQNHLKDIITGKRFLLVLDNMWKVGLLFWDKLRASLIYGAEGSKVLVTTQNEYIANIMQQVHILHLQGLSVDDGLLLFQDLVFAKDERIKVLTEHKKLVVIGKKIVKKCQGFPLAIKAISSLLYSETDEEQWQQLSDELLENETVADAIMPILKTSYDHLPWRLKRCFSFCSTFPKDYEFSRDELVKLWMAVGLIKNEGARKIEDVGGGYFNDLLRRSFFQASDSNMKDSQKYKMPTMIHELAQHLFRYESLIINRDVAEHGESGIGRYGLLYHYDQQPVTFNKLFENKGLRALMLYGKNGVPRKEVLIDLFEKQKLLRLLDLSSSCLEELPDSVCNLILLRYLDLHDTNIKRLPETVGNLYNLQTLELRNCHQIQELPNSIGDLKNLRHLGLNNTSIRRLPETVGNLSDLQTLEIGNCHQIQELPNSIGDLKNLRHLGLDNCHQILELPDSIGDLENLRHLGLHNTSIRRLPETVSNLLNLRTLELGNCYKLEMLPKSMNKLDNLGHLGLDLDWDSWDGKIDLISMPPEIGSLTSLRVLSRFALGSDPQSRLGDLENLILRGKLCITKLENVVSVQDAKAANLSGKQYIDSLMLRWSDTTRRNSENVPKEDEVINQLQPHTNLQYLRLENYNGVKFPFWMEDPSFEKLETLKLINCKMCQSLPCVWNLPSLKNLQIKGLHQVREFGFVRSGFEYLETLNVSDIPQLYSWFRIAEGQMSRLTSLCISDCPNLRFLTYLPPSIKTFELRNCQNLPVFNILPKLQDLVLENDRGSRLIWVRSLFSLTSLTLSKLSLIQDEHKGIFKYLIHLKKLIIQDCCDLDSLDGLENHYSLEYLEISSCPKLTSFCKMGLPKNLKGFRLHNCPSLESLPQELHLLSSLGSVEIHSVSLLASMPRLPSCVEKLVIKECSLLNERCQKNGDNWAMIQHIPYIQVDQNDYHHGHKKASTLVQNIMKYLWK